MNIVIDVSRMHPANQHRGVGLYAQSLYEQLLKLKTNHTFRLKTQPHQNLQTDVVHYPFFDFFFPTLPLKKIAPTIVTIHDAIPLVYPNYYKPGIRGKFNYLKQRLSLKSVDQVITMSQTSKSDIARYLAYPSAKITPIALAGNPRLNARKLETMPSILKSLSIEKPFYLYVGDINYNKNIHYLLTGFAAASADCQLVLVAKAMANNIPEAQAINQTISELKLEKRVIIATDIPSDPIEPLLWLYQNAHAYIQPSLYEGFGIPVIEALSCGTIVASSTGGSLKEFDSPPLFKINPEDPKSLTQALEQVNHLSTNKRSHLITQGIAYAHTFSWQKCAQETLRVYERAYARK